MNMATEEDIKCGWVQLNNTVVPYIIRHLSNGMPTMLTPLPVIQYGAGLLQDVHVQCLISSEVEFDALNHACKSAGLDFSFDNPVEFISLHELVKKYRTLNVNFLPDDDPFGNSRFKSENDDIVHNKSTAYAADGETGILDLSKTSNIKEEYSDKSSSDIECSIEVPLDLSRTSPSREEVKPDVEILSTFIPPRKDRDVSDLHALLQTSPSNGVYVRPIRLQHRTIPCIIKGGIPYVLVETIRKAYFSYCSLRAFMFMVERCVSPFIYELDKDDIATIMSVAKSATSLMKCSKVISVRDADQMLPIIKNFLARVERHRQLRRPKTPAKDQQTSISGVIRSHDFANKDPVDEETTTRIRGTILDHEDITSGMIQEMLPERLPGAMEERKTSTQIETSCNTHTTQTQSALRSSTSGISSSAVKRNLSNYSLNASEISASLPKHARVNIKQRAKNIQAIKDAILGSESKINSSFSKQNMTDPDKSSVHKTSGDHQIMEKNRAMPSPDKKSKNLRRRLRETIKARVEFEESLGELLSSGDKAKNDSGVESASETNNSHPITQSNSSSKASVDGDHEIQGVEVEKDDSEDHSVEKDPQTIKNDTQPDNNKDISHDNNTKLIEKSASNAPVENVSEETKIPPNCEFDDVFKKPKGVPRLSHNKLSITCSQKVEAQI